MITATTIDDRTRLIQAVRGEKQVQNPHFYDLKDYGGFDLLLSFEPLTERELLIRGRENYESKRATTIDFARRYPSLSEEYGPETPEYGFIQEAREQGIL